MATKSVKKIMDEVKSRNLDEVDLQDKAIVKITDIPHLCKKFSFSFLRVRIEIDSDRKIMQDISSGLTLMFSNLLYLLVILNHVILFGLISDLLVIIL